MSVVHHNVGLAVHTARDEAKRILTELESKSHPETNQSSASNLALVGIQKRLLRVDPPPAPIAQFISELEELLRQCDGKLAPVKPLIEEALRTRAKSDWKRNPCMTGLAVRVRPARLRKGWAQYELAHRSGVDQRTISRIENGQTRGVGLGTVERLAHALRVSPRSLLVSVRRQEDDESMSTAPIFDIPLASELLQWHRHDVAAHEPRCPLDARDVQPLECARRRV